MNIEGMHQRWLDAARLTMDTSAVASINTVIEAFLTWNKQADVTRARVQRFVDQARSHGNQTRRIKAMKSFFARHPDIAAKLHTTTVAERRSNCEITAPQYGAIRESVKAEPDSLLLVDLMWECGLALVDACSLKWSMVNLQTNQIVGARNKTAEQYRIPIRPGSHLHQALVGLASEPHDKASYVSDRNRLRYLSSQSSAFVEIVRALREAGVPAGTGVHGFRRAFVSRLVRANIHPNTIVVMTGHSSTDSLGSYSRSDDATLRQAIYDATPGPEPHITSGREADSPHQDTPADGTDWS
jgi:integrase